VGRLGADHPEPFSPILGCLDLIAPPAEKRTDELADWLLVVDE